MGHRDGALGWGTGMGHRDGAQGWGTGRVELKKGSEPNLHLGPNILIKSGGGAVVMQGGDDAVAISQRHHVGQTQVHLGKGATHTHTHTHQHQ